MKIYQSLSVLHVSSFVYMCMCMYVRVCVCAHSQGGMVVWRKQSVNFSFTLCKLHFEDREDKREECSRLNLAAQQLRGR